MTRSASAPHRRAARAVTSHASSFARNPGRYATAPKTENKVGLAVILFFLVMGAASVRAGHWPDSKGMLSVAGGTLVVVALSAVAPELVVNVLIAALIIFALTNTKVATGIFGAAFGNINKTIVGRAA